MKKRITLGVALAATLSLVSTAAVVAQDEQPPYSLEPFAPGDFGAVSITEQVDGQPITYWIERAGEWFWLPPMSEHPGVQGDCQLGQGGPVFFLHNVRFGTAQVFDCTIGTDQHILVSPGGGFGFNTEPDETPEGLYQMSIDNSMTITDPEVVVDGRSIPMGGSTWYQRDPYALDLVEGNLFGYPAGEVTAVSNGWWVMLAPLEPGPHTVVISDTTLMPAISPGDIDPSGLVVGDPSPVGETARATAVFNITVEDAGASAE